MAGFEVTLHGRFCTDPWGRRTGTVPWSRARPVADTRTAQE